MSPALRAGVSVVVLALACYTAGVLSAQRRRMISTLAIRLLIAGVVLDVIATAFMIVGSGRVLTLHGVLGYSALAGMLADAWLSWQHRRASGDAPTPTWLHRYTRVAYAWWVIAFIAGAVMAATLRNA